MLYVSRTLMAEDEMNDDDRAVFLDHGVDVDHFTHRNGAAEPDDLARIARPRVGYFGNLSDYRVDFDLLERIAASSPTSSWSWSVRPPARWIASTSSPNVHWFGPRSYEEIPRYGSGFDVGLMPYLRNEWIRNSNPIKMKEYLALGLPVVSTEVPEVARYTDWLFMADSPDDFLAKLRSALDGGAPSTPEGRRAAVAPFSWDGRAAELVRIAES